MWNFHKTSSVFIKLVPFIAESWLYQLRILLDVYKNRVRNYYGRTLSLIPAVYGHLRVSTAASWLRTALLKLVRVLA